MNDRNEMAAFLEEGFARYVGASEAVDVFEREPPKPEHWIWRHPRVLATPHIAAQASTETVAQQCLDALQRARDGLPQPHAVDRRAGY